MARCAECVHFDVCYLSEIDNDIRDSGENPNCLHFISTADVVEVKHAYWKMVTETKNNTVCGDGVQIQKKVCSNCEQPMGVCGTDYCGYCGAIMDAKSREGNIITQKNIAKLERARSIIEKAGINSRDTRSSLVSAIALIDSVLWEVKK